MPGKKYIFIVCLVMMLFIVWVMYPYNYYQQDISLGSTSPSCVHWFGTDLLGRDLFSRVMYATCTSLCLGIIITLFTVAIGTVYGMVSGYFGGCVDLFMMRFVDVLYPIPLTLVAILLMAICGKNTYILFLAIGLIEWMTTSKIVRSEVIRLREYGFICCARCMGQSTQNIITMHIFPNIVNVVIACFLITLPGIILLESFFSFLGIGIQPPKTSLGILISDGAKYISTYSWLVIFPAIFLVIMIYLLSILGDRMRKQVRI